MTPADDLERIRFLRRRLAVAQQAQFHVDDAQLLGLGERRDLDRREVRRRHVARDLVEPCDLCWPSLVECSRTISSLGAS